MHAEQGTMDGNVTAAVTAAQAKTADGMAEVVPAAPMRVFVHLARDKDAIAWSRAWHAGTLVGVNDESPYGYKRAEAMGCRIAFSRSEPESLPGKTLRLAIRVLTGFDYLHARRQRRELTDADVIWTHTESQFLAVAAVLGTRGRAPVVLGQSVWLFDRWPRLTPLHRWLYRRLIGRVDLLTTHSPANLSVARALFPGRRAEFVPFGIPAERMTAPRRRSAAPAHVLALGNDQHRDWTTLVEAVRGQDDIQLTILSGTVSARLTRGLDNVRVGRATTNAALQAAFAKATLVCVPLRPNMHASGITVVQEAVLSGVPVVVSRTGGLEAYFTDEHVTYVPVGDTEHLRASIRDLAADPDRGFSMAKQAQDWMQAKGLGAEAFVRRHVELSRDVLRR